MTLTSDTRPETDYALRPASIRRMVALPQRDGLGTAPATLATFDGLQDAGEHVALMWNPPTERPLVRIHSECLTGDALGSARCDCGEQLAETRALLSEVGGILLYLRQEGRGIGLYNKIDAYALQDLGADTVDANVRLGFPADGRRYGVAAQMLLALGYSQVRLLTNNPEKIAGLEAGGVGVADRVGTGLHVLPANRAYLETKRIRMGHLYGTCPLPAPTGRG
jgi:GTP cyclohydrolase II